MEAADFRTVHSIPGRMRVKIGPLRGDDELARDLEAHLRRQTGVLVGFGAGLVAPSLFPDTGSKVRPVAKTVVKGVLAVTEGLRTAVAEATEQVNDLVAEVRAERANGDGGSSTHR